MISPEDERLKELQKRIERLEQLAREARLEDWERRLTKIENELAESERSTQKC